VQEAESAWTQALLAGRIGPPGPNMEIAPAGSSMPNVTPIHNASTNSLSSATVNPFDPGEDSSDPMYWVVTRGRNPGVYAGR